MREKNAKKSGWRLPIGGPNSSPTNEFRILYNAISTNHGSSIAKDSTSPFSLQAMLSTPVSGNFGTAATAVRIGTYGYFWSSSYYSAADVYYMRVSGTAVGSQDSNDRYNGISIRCIAAQ